jgi:hypothetical protein
MNRLIDINLIMSLNPRQDLINWAKDCIKELEAGFDNGNNFCLKCNKYITYDECEHDGKYLLVCSDPYEPEGPREVVKFLKFMIGETK